MTIETDTRVRRGEQLGVIVTLSNYWHQDLEVCRHRLHITVACAIDEVLPTVRTRYCVAC